MKGDGTNRQIQTDGLRVPGILFRAVGLCVLLYGIHGGAPSFFLVLKGNADPAYFPAHMEVFAVDVGNS